MKALSLWNPWAILMAIRAKQHETRSWGTGYRGDVVIHAAKHFTEEEIAVCYRSEFSAKLKEAGYLKPFDLPRGAALGIAELVDIRRTIDVRDRIGADERAFGDYSDGRFAWQFENFRRFPKPLPSPDRQGLWDWPLSLYTFGYSGSTPEKLQNYAEYFGAMVVDIRCNPTSRVPHWRLPELRRLLSERYVHFGELGNINYKNGGPIMLANPGAGIDRLAVLLANGPAIILCGCQDHRECHRAVVADLMAKSYGATIKHLEG